MHKVAMVDDHVLLREGLAALVNTFPDFTVVLQAKNGKDFTEQLDPDNLPSVVLMDISMDEMDGYDTTRWLRKNFPEIKVIAISMLDSESSIIRMIKCGARGYLLKNSNPADLEKALNSILTSDFYMNDLVNNRMIRNLQNEIGKDSDNKLSKPTAKETQFLKLVCSEKSYKQIADEMNVSPRTIDGYRDSLFKKLNVTSRIGLAMYAVKNKLVELE